MLIEIRFIATLRQYLPSNSPGCMCTIEVPDGTRVIDVLSQLGVPVEPAGSVVVLVNGRQAELYQVLHERDALSAFPAMAGGQALIALRKAESTCLVGMEDCCG
jgi:hypothetical protein